MTSKLARKASDTDAIVQRLWSFCNVLKDDGVSYTDYVEQLTYLLFLKMEDERPATKVSSRIPEDYRWKSLIGKSGIGLETHYLATLQTLSSQSGIVGEIFYRAQNRIQDAAKLKRLIGLIDAESWSIMDTDVKGAIYEGLLEKNAEDVKSGAGQYFTSRPLVSAIVEVMHILPGESVCDPACGTGGFLLAAHQQVLSRTSDPTTDLSGSVETSYSGWEIVPATARLCMMNVHLRGIDERHIKIHIGDALVDEPGERFDVVLSNPPFGRRSSMVFTNEEKREDRDALTYHRRDFVATTSNKQLNFLQHIVSTLAPRGRAAVIVPDNVLFEGGAGEAIRRNLLDTCDVHTLLRLPPGIFYAGSVKANVLFFDRLSPKAKKRKRRLWVYDLRTGYRFSLRANPMTDTDLAGFIAAFGEEPNQRVESASFKSFDVEEIIASDRCTLDIGIAPVSDIDELPPPEVLMTEIMDRLAAAAAAIKTVEDQLR